MLPGVGGRKRAGGIGEPPELGEGRGDVASQVRRMQGEKIAVEGQALGRAEHVGREEALIGRLRVIVTGPALAADATAGGAVAKRAKEVELGAQEAVEALEQGPGGARAVAIAADESAHGQPVALLDPGLIILPIHAPARELDLVSARVVEEAGVEEFAPIVGVPFRVEISQAALNIERRRSMSLSISTLLIRNLRDVFGENDRARRRAAIDEIWTEDGVFYDPKSGVHRGHDAIDRVAGAIKATHPDFEYQPIAEPEELGNGGRVQWVSGRPGEAPAYAGTDFIIVRDGRIAALYLFFDKLP